MSQVSFQDLYLKLFKQILNHNTQHLPLGKGGHHWADMQ